MQIKNLKFSIFKLNFISEYEKALDIKCIYS